MSTFYTQYVPPPRSKQPGKLTQTTTDVSPKRKRDDDKSERRKDKRQKVEREEGAREGKKNRKKAKEGGPLPVADELNPASAKHARLLSKFSKVSTTRSDSRPNGERSGSDEDREDVLDQVQEELHGLEPFVPPKEVERRSGKPTYSTRQAWQSEAVRAVAGQHTTFDDMGLSKEMLANLQKNKISEAFPIQSTVIPLLLDSSLPHPRDVCVAAATGSGKTIAYVVPVVEALKQQHRLQGLHAVIVVPTRELVRQVKETCEMCVSGTKIKVATAVGSKSLRDEQDKLVEEVERYDPVEARRFLDSPVDWDKFNLQEVLDSVDKRDWTYSWAYILEKRLTPNILIVTPGRLVEHLKNTPGFHLDDVEWLVVDEADRLLNESYQEWIEVVMPALRSTRATKQRDDLLAAMRMKPPPRRVRKVLLSATMTEDISKLNALELQDPQLVKLDPSKVDLDTQMGIPVPDEDHGYALPSSLQETAVLLKDGTDKPLVLLRLLQENIALHQSDVSDPKLPPADETSSSGSDSDSDASDDDDTSSSDSDGTSSESSVGDTTSKPSHRPVPKRAGMAIRTKEPLRPKRALIFTRSTAAAARLKRLLTLLDPGLSSVIASLTKSTASSASSRQALAAFRSGKTAILIATDRASRGLDVPGLEHVISYDMPGSALTYVHRVGRTARAGRPGEAWTLVEHREGRWFWKEIGGKARDCQVRRDGKIAKVEMTVDDQALRDRYDTALQTLGEEVRAQ